MPSYALQRVRDLVREDVGQQHSCGRAEVLWQAMFLTEDILGRIGVSATWTAKRPGLRGPEWPRSQAGRCFERSCGHKEAEQ